MRIKKCLARITCTAFVVLGSNIALGQSAVFAPEVGSYVIENVYDKTTSFNTRKVIASKDTSRDLYQVVRFVIMNDGSERSMGRDQEMGEFLRQDFITDIRKECQRRKGRLENLTIALGTFLTCKTIFDDGNLKIATWYAANIPFGQVKSVDLNGTGYDHELIGFGSK
jgi:hypothetical protein